MVTCLPFAPAAPGAQRALLETPPHFQGQQGTLAALGGHGCGQWERRVIRQQLADEVDGQIVTPAEYAQLQREPAYGLHRPAGYTHRKARALVNAQNKLAFRKWDVRAAGANPQTDGVAEALRAEIRSIRSMERLAGAAARLS